jgi:tetratricopeptide (TPR) repeat protein
MPDESQPEIVTIWNEAKDYIDHGKFDKAIDTYNYILVRYGDDTIAVEHASAYLGDIYLTLRHPELAESHIRKAIACAPEKPAYRYQLGFVYSHQSKWAKAVREFEAAVKNSPDNAEYLRGLGWAAFNGCDKAKGLECLQRAIELAPSEVNILLDLANAYLTMLDFKQASKYAKTAVELEPENELARVSYEKICQFEKAYLRSKDAPFA